MNDDLFLKSAEIIQDADGLLITAGAGMGVDSGLPDFRGTDGFWNAYPALRQSGIHFQDIACPDAFHATPELAWGFYGHRLALYRRTIPHCGFEILRHIADRMPHGAFIFTSNVDGQFQKAGFVDERIYECHGSIHHLQCLKPCKPSIWPADFTPEIDDERCRMTSPLPTCPDCGDLARPNIMMFGDWGWFDQRARVQAKRLTDWRAKVKSPVIIELGAGIDIPSVRLFSEEQTRFGTLIRINPRAPQIPRSATGISLPLGALPAMDGINDALFALGFWDGS
jgi:NAD-dependent SIR2 family protein deacetylase